MSTYNRIRVLIGLGLLGSLGWVAMRNHALADEPRDANSPALAASTPRERYLMLSNGKLVVGVVSEDARVFRVRQRLGVLPYPRSQVAGVFDTVRAAYDYQLQQLPDRDCEERMKLARWCLSLKLRTEAQEQLQKVLELSPRHPQAQAMLLTMEQADALAAQRRRDPEVRQTGAEEAVDTNPGALDSLVIQKARRGLRIMGVPVVFDLPAPLAVKRFHEFVNYVNPLLQAHCVKCHDGKYNGEFQLVSTKTRIEQTADAFRVNLDATLRLVDQDNLAKSELLTTTLRPHGPRKRPIFPGSNDKAYQVIATWVQSLGSPKESREFAHGQAGRPEPEPAPAEPFAVGRGRIGNESPDDAQPMQYRDGRSPATEAQAPAQTRPRIPRPASFAPVGDMSRRGPAQAAPDDFPLPFVITGKKPNIAPPQAAAGAGAESAPKQPPAGATGTRKLGAAADATKPGDKQATPTKKAKPVTIDPSLLERALQIRNTTNH